MKPPIYIKKPRSKLKVFMGSNLFLFGFILIFLLIFYSGNFGQILNALLFSYFTITILLCFLIPISNLILLYFVPNFYDLLLGITDLKGDLFTEVFMITTIITYIVSCYIVIVATSVIAWGFLMHPENYQKLLKKLEYISLYKPSKR